MTSRYMNDANILQCGITETNIGLKVLNYLFFTLTDIPPKGLFSRRLMLRVKLLDDKHFSLQIFYNTFLNSIYTKFVAFQHGKFARFANDQRSLRCF